MSSPQKYLIPCLIAVMLGCVGFVYSSTKIEQQRKVSAKVGDTKFEVPMPAKAAQSVTFLSMIAGLIGTAYVSLKKWAPVVDDVTNKLNNPQQLSVLSDIVGLLKNKDIGSGQQLLTDLLKSANFQAIIADALKGSDFKTILADALKDILPTTPSNIADVSQLMALVPDDVREIVSAAIARSSAPSDTAAEKRFIMALLDADATYIGNKNQNCRAAVANMATEVIAHLFSPDEQPAPPKPGPLAVTPVVGKSAR